MFTISNIKLIIGATIVGMLVVAAGLIYFLFGQLNSVREDLILTKASLATQVEINQNLIEDIHGIKDSYNHLLNQNEENVVALEELRNKFANDGKGWEYIIGAKPKLVEKIINNATQMRMRCFEIASGSPVTEEEKNGKNKNTVCPQFFVGN